MRGNTAVILSVSGHLDVSLATPAGSPAVLDEEVVGAVVGAVADGGDTVVQELGGAVWLVVDTILVELEAHV